MSDASVSRIDELDLAFVPKPWPFANDRRADIDAYFAALRRQKPTMWNGRVLLMHHHKLAEGVLHGQFLETDYASFAAWRDWGMPAAGVVDCFGAAAVLSADGAFLLGEMGPHTFNAGQIYFPCGTPDPDDIVGDKVDLDVSIRRELKEETGIDPAALTPEPGWTMIVDGPMIAQIKVLRAKEASAVLRERALAHLASERQPELSNICVVRGLQDITSAMPSFVTSFLASRFADR